jgi:hypothetical protein
MTPMTGIGAIRAICAYVDAIVRTAVETDVPVGTAKSCT